MPLAYRILIPHDHGEAVLKQNPSVARGANTRVGPWLTLSQSQGPHLKGGLVRGQEGASLRDCLVSACFNC
jgi:hypothetical protein